MGLKKYNQSEEVDSKTIEKNKMVVKHEVSEEKLVLTPSDEELSNKINDARKDYLLFAKKQKKVNYLITGIVLAVMVVIFVLIIFLGSSETRVLYAGLGVMVVVLIITFFLSKFLKDKISGAAQIYIDTLFKNINSYLYAKGEYQDLQIDPRGSLQSSLFIDARFYKNIRATRSRNIVTLTYRGKKLSIADLAGNVLVKGKTMPMFLGRLYDYENFYSKSEKRILFQLKGGQLSRPLDDIEDLKLVEGNDTYAIYTNDEDYKTVLTPKVISKLEKFKVDNILIDVLVSIRPGKTVIGIDYADDFMNIPVESDFKFSTVKRSQSDLELTLEILDELA
jgi:hypothetical protein